MLLDPPRLRLGDRLAGGRLLQADDAAHDDPDRGADSEQDQPDHSQIDRMAETSAVEQADPEGADGLGVVRVDPAGPPCRGSDRRSPGR